MGTNYAAWGAVGEGLGQGVKTLSDAYTNAFQKKKAEQRADEMGQLKQELGRGQLDLAQQRLDMQQQLAEAKAAKAVNPLTGGNEPKTIMQIKNDYDQMSKNYVGAREGWNKVSSAVNNPSPVGDISLIFGFMKTIDPTSTVREGEFATASNAGGVPERITNMYNRVKNGERLTSEQRKDFAVQSYNAYKTYEDSFKQNREYTVDLAKAFGISPELVAPSYEATAAPNPNHGIPKGGVNPLKLARAQQALNDPEATDKEKARAQQIISGGQ